MKNNEIFSIELDQTAGAIYVRFSQNKVHKTKEIAPEVFLDLDYKGTPVGLELINPGAVGIELIKKIEQDYNLPKLSRLAERPLLEAAMNM